MNCIIFDLTSYISDCQKAVNERLSYWLSQNRGLSESLANAMEYATMNGGKRIRPVLAFAAAQAVGGTRGSALDAACALELLHSYSLVHDDLPAMDNDELRRGKPTCHIAFNEATAILAGNSLQSLAFEVLAKSDIPEMTPSAKIDMIKTLAESSGGEGMADGQALDLAAEGQTPGLDELENIHHRKTGCLITAAVHMGAIASGQATPSQLELLDNYAIAVGLAFQVQDDILDVIGDTQTLGKHKGSDAEQNKATYPGILGLDNAQTLVQTLHEQALDSLTSFGSQAEPMRKLSEFIVSRHY